MLSKIDTTILDNIIVGRVEPYIYAFSTETVPNYLKVGDTSRGVRVRLDEWRKIFPNLVQQYEHSAQIDADTIFRDYAIHVFLEQEKNRKRLQPYTFENLPYYSREFFKDATPKDIEEAIEDIIQSATERNGKYPLYSPDRLPQIFTYERTESFTPRANQKQAIDNFKAAVEAGRSNLLLYAVMRFGKSFTSMCCAKEINARFVVIVSAKADVKEEWKRTVESHTYFENFNYLDSNALKRNETVIADTLAEPDKKVALFLTLQDLQGNDIKEKHKEVFEHRIDLLIIDETHFGARGESYGKVLEEQRLSKSEIDIELKNLDGFETLDRVEDAVKILNAKIKLHLSGTPYRILMSDEFQKDDIIAFVQYTDIIEAQQQWNDEHLKEDDCEEWKNPYFGFPQMIRFAFNPNESSRRKMEQMHKDGISYAFSELFRPLSMTVHRDGSHRQFKHEVEILDLLEVIDGTKEDENLLGFLDYDKIKDGKMCRHIVCVLPFRASCDALSDLIKKNKGRFKNLGDYEILNIAGFDDERKYKSTDDVKRTIKEFETQNKKTLTLTVNRMLTGTTVPQWDTMLYLKGTASPQEYDQAIFRLLNQYITTFKNESGKIIKYNMKPQTLLVDFDPNRMFVLQEQKSQFYNVNTEVQGNSQLKDRIAKELEVSPIIVLNKNKLLQATPTDITDAVREYSRTRSVLDDATEIPADNDLMQDDTLAAILRTIEPIDAKKGLQIKPSEGDGDDIDVPQMEETDASEDSRQSDNTSANTEQQKQNGPVENDNLHKRLAAFYARILFFAFLTESTVKSLEDVIAMIPTNEDNCRIAHNLGLNIDILTLVQRKSNPFVLQKFDYKIENVNDLMRDESLTPIKRVEIAMRKFGRMSESEIVTPLNLADDMVKLLPDNLFSLGPVLDIASKQGEFTIALLKRFGYKAANGVYSVCTSKLAYEFTRKVYLLLSLPVDHIFESFTSYDIIKKDKNKKFIIPQILKDMKFATIIGNPPYQEAGLNNNKAEAIYPYFYDIAERISGINILISPARFLFNAGLTPKVWNQKMLSDEHISVVRYFHDSADVFPNTNINGGVAIILRNQAVKSTPIGMFIPNTTLRGIAQRFGVSTPNLDSIGFGGRSDLKFNEVFLTHFPNTKEHILAHLKAEHPEITELAPNEEYELKSSSFARTSFAFVSEEPEDSSKYYKILGIENGQRTWKWVLKEYLTPRYPERNNIDKYKIFISKADGAAGQIGKPIPARIVGKPILGEPYSSSTASFISLGNFDSKEEAQNLMKYAQTKFARVLLGVLKVTQDITPSKWSYVPMQDFTSESDIDWSKSLEEIDAQLYAKYNLSDEEIAFIESMIKPM